MLLLVCSCVALNLCDVADGLFVFAEWQEDFFYFVLVEVDVGIEGDVFDDVAFEFEWVDGFSLRIGYQSLDLWLIGAPHRLYNWMSN